MTDAIVRRLTTILPLALSLCALSPRADAQGAPTTARAWGGSFTQEWPAPGMAHQSSYTLPFSGTGRAGGIGDVLLNYRYQLREEDARGPAVSPRLSVILPTGREADGLGSGTAGPRRCST